MYGNRAYEANRNYGNGGYGGQYGGYGGYNNGSFYAQPSYSQSQPSYAQSCISQPSDIRQTSATAPQNFDGGEVVLFSAANTPGDVQYTLNGTPFVLQPGQVQRFRNDRTWIIEVPPSAGQAQQRFTLATGRYKFKPVANGIGLVQTADQPGGESRSNSSLPAPASSTK